MKKIITAAALALITASNVSAAEDIKYIPYIGADYTNSAVSGYNQKGGYYTPHYNGAALILGTTIGQYFGTEMFVQKTDTHKKDGIKTNFQAYGLDMVGYLPFGCDLQFNLIATFGVGEYHMHGKSKPAGIKNHTDHGWGWRTGVGAQYNFDDNWSIRAVARHVNFDGIHTADHMIEYTAGIRYKF